MFGKFNSPVVAETNLPAWSINEVKLLSVNVIADKASNRLQVKFGKDIGSTYQVANVNFSLSSDKKDVTKRNMGTYGANPSMQEQVEVLIGQLLSALVPSFFSKLIQGEVAFKATTWNEYIAEIKDVLDTDEAKQGTYFLKLCKDGYINSYPAVTKKGSSVTPVEGDLEVRTNFISRNILEVSFTKSELTSKEKTEKAQTARPAGFDDVASMDAASMFS